MNTIINVSNILFKKKQEAENDTTEDSIITEGNVAEYFNIEEKPHLEKKQEVSDIETPLKIDNKVITQKYYTSRSFSLSSSFFYKIVYEVIIFFFYILLSPVYFFDTYTINSNSPNPDSLHEIHSKVDINAETRDFANERLFFPKKLIPQSVATKRKLLILDLDETLIHSTNISEEPSSSSEEAPKESPKIESFQIEVCFKLPKNTQIPSIFANSQISSNESSKQTEISTIYNIKQRPHLMQFLKTCSLWYDMLIYTASLREYSEPIINNLEYISGVTFKGRLYRHDCKISAGGYVKPLDHIMHYETNSNINGSKGSVGKEGMIMLDNMAVSFQEDEYNGIEIEGWYGKGEDIELLKLLPLLEGLRNVADVRRVLSLSHESGL